MSIVKLNVGGTKFMTTESTLGMYNSNLLNMIDTTRFSPLTDDDGYIFIDRDPEIFKHILFFFRNSKLNFTHINDELLEHICDDAEFYCCNELKKYIKKYKCNIKKNDNSDCILTELKKIKLELNFLNKNKKFDELKFLSNQIFDLEAYLKIEYKDDLFAFHVIDKTIHIVIEKIEIIMSLVNCEHGNPLYFESRCYFINNSDKYIKNRDGHDFTMYIDLKNCTLTNIFKHNIAHHITLKVD